jgi:hypothetical protein
MLENLQEKTVGNAKYYCVDCDYTWKKYRGKKPYERIKVIYADAGGYPGPYFHVKIDFKSLLVEKNPLIEYHLSDLQSSTPPTREEFEWFRSELYKCDFLNWAEEFEMLFVMDGTHWSVRIEYDDYCEIKTGSNHFPPKWSKFCKAVAKLSGREFY